MKRRIVYIDILKAFAIFLVVWGHAIMHLSNSDYHMNIVWQWIYSFHMPLFMIMVGFFAYSSLSKPVKDFIRHKSTQLIIPCFSWIFITYIAMLIVIPGYHLSVKTFVNALFQEIWFLKSAFLCYLLFYFSSKVVNYLKVDFHFILGGGISLIIIQIVPLYKLNQMYPCFLCGVFLYRYSDSILKNWKLVTIVSTIIYIILVVCLSDYDFIPISKIKKELLSGNFSVLFDLFLTQLYSIGIGVSAAISLVALFYGFINRLSKRNKVITTLSTVGKYTLAIYLIQTLLLEKIAAQYININEISESIFNLIITPIFSAIIIYMSMCIAHFIELDKTLSYYLLGKDSSNR